MKKITFFVLIVFAITVQGQNKLLSSIQENYDGSSWENSYGTNYGYDGNNNLITETNYDWTDTGVWTVSNKTTYTYNGSNKATEQLYQNWDATTSSFKNLDKSTYTYTSGRLTEIIFFKWSSPNWVFQDKTTISYNGNNLPASAISYDWDGSNWVPTYRSQIAYNLNNKISSSLDDKWLNGQWVLDSRNSLTYNGANKIVTNIYEDWDGSNWSESDRTEYEFDATGNRTKETENSNSYSYREEYAYDTASQMSSFVNPFKDKTGVDYLFEDFPYINKVLSSVSSNYDSMSSSYVMNSRTTYDYNNSLTLSTEKFDLATTIIAYPNPTKDFLSLQKESNADISKVIVTDLSGKTVLQEDKNTAQIDVENLEKGMYLLQVFSGDKKMQTKFIKE